MFDANEKVAAVLEKLAMYIAEEDKGKSSAFGRAASAIGLHETNQRELLSNMERT